MDVRLCVPEEPKADHEDAGVDLLRIAEAGKDLSGNARRHAEGKLQSLLADSSATVPTTNWMSGTEPGLLMAG